MSNSKMNFIIVVLSLMTTLSLVLSEICIQDGPCSCHVKGGKVDLKRLATPNPRFRNVPSPKDKSNFTYNPCVGIASGCSPSDADRTVAVCQWDVGGKFNNGLADTATFLGEPGTSGFGIRYNHMDGSFNRTSTVRLICTEDEAEFRVIGEVKTVTYEFELRSKYCCKVKVGLSTGSALLIIFFVLLLVYIVGGVLFLHFVRGAQGVEMIPNREFWKEVPSLVYDGCRFVVKGCKADTTYSQI